MPHLHALGRRVFPHNALKLEASVCEAQKYVGGVKYVGGLEYVGGVEHVGGVSKSR